MLCPVSAVRSYFARHAHRPCLHPHPVLPHITINYLIRGIRNCHIPVHSQRITNHINAVMDLLPPVTHKGRLHARALGSTGAVLAEASVDEVVTMATGQVKPSSTHFTGSRVKRPQSCVRLMYYATHSFH
jgi:hypothetical protein